MSKNGRKKMLKDIIERIIGNVGSVAMRNANPNVRRGRWGEDVAAEHLKCIGWRIIGRNVRPCRRDRRCELDIVAYIPGERQIVFVEVKTHRKHSSYAGRLWAIDRRKKSNLLRAGANWLMERKWHGNCRFDVIEVYGEENGDNPPEIDHITNVRLFPSNWRFW
jgi:putative endonuclease